MILCKLLVLCILLTFLVLVFAATSQFAFPFVCNYYIIAVFMRSVNIKGSIQNSKADCFIRMKIYFRIPTSRI